MRGRTLREWFQWGRWARYVFGRLLDPDVFFILVWQKYGTNGASVMVHFHSGRPDKRLNELQCLETAALAQLAEEKRKLAGVILPHHQAILPLREEVD